MTTGRMMPNWIRNRSFSLTALGLFLLAMLGQTIAGLATHNQNQAAHGQAPASLGDYLLSGHFGEATFENWESEFLQMAVFIVLTSMLIQRGSAESRKPEDEDGAGEQPIDERPENHRHDANAPWPVRSGGLALALYRRSLGLVLLLLFLAAFAGHALTGVAEYNADQVQHGERAISALAYIATPRFWFESFQNWQSEFLSVWALTVLSIWFRQEGSPESKPVHAPHEQTGAE